MCFVEMIIYLVLDTFKSINYVSMPACFNYFFLQHVLLVSVLMVDVHPACKVLGNSEQDHGERVRDKQARPDLKKASE